MKHEVFQSAALFTAMLLLCSCASSPSGKASLVASSVPITPSSISVSVSPASTSLGVGQTLQFNAIVANDPSHDGVSWSVSGDCTGTDCGTFSTSGLYTAPSTPHYAPGLTIIAKSNSDPSKSGTAVVFVDPAATGIAVSPSVATVQPGSKLSFTSTSYPFASLASVMWSVTGPGCTGSTCGTIDTKGNYRAPDVAPNPPTVAVIATSVSDSTVSGSATITLASNPNNAMLNGQYAFLIQGYDSDGNVAEAGSFIADGKGNITSGVADFNLSSSILVRTNADLNGTYSVDSNGRATLNFVSTLGFNQSFTVALNSISNGVANRGRLVELDGLDFWTTALLAKQDPTAFSTAAINGGFAFGFNGTGPTGWPLSVAGRFTANSGTLSLGQADMYGLGRTISGSGTAQADTNVPFTGSYQVSSSGRGTAALNLSNSPGISNFSFYVISAAELLFLETDTCSAGEICSFKGGIAGTALQQSQGPFTNASMNTSSVFESTTPNDNASAGLIAVGIEHFDGRGGVSGTRSENDAGSISQNVSFSGQYSMDANGLGRGMITIGSVQRPIYLVSPGNGFMISLSNNEDGRFEPQTGGPFKNQSLFGNYSLGSLPWNFNWKFSPLGGVLNSDGAGNLSGTLDSHSGTNQPFQGSFSVASTGETTISITPRDESQESWIFYLISPSRAVGIDVGGPGTTAKSIAIIEK